MSSSNAVPLGAVLGLVLTAVVVGGGLYLADRQNLTTVREHDEARLSELMDAGMVVLRRVRDLPADDPLAEIWERTPSREVPVTPQAMTMPVLEDTSITAVRVQGLTDGARVAWRLSWPDPSPDMNVDAARFCDAVAIQFPISPDASYMMGGYDQRVQILHWKGVWQKDVDEGFQDVQDLHPNYWADLYWFAQGRFPYPVPDAFADPVSRQWFPAYQAGNPVSDFSRQRAVEELVAEGFGTLTSQEMTATSGRGVWHDGTWSVVFTRPFATDDPFDYQFSPGMIGSFAVAVWEGAAGNAGGRKHFSQWFEFKME